MNLQILIADDEPAQRAQLQKQLQQLWPDVVIHLAEDGPQAVQILQSQRIFAAFLDIRMPGISGLEIARSASATTHIVFVTAYDNYAISAFEAGAVDYLLKPFDPLRLSQTITRLQKRVNSQPDDLRQLLSQLNLNVKRPSLNWIQASSGNTLHFVAIEDVLYFQSDAKYTKVVTAQQEFFIRKSIRDLREELNEEQFWQIHRSTLVAVERIERVQRDGDGAILLKLRQREEYLPVSQSYQHLFRQM